MAEKHLKKCSTSLVIKEMQIKKTLRFHLTLVRMAKIKNSDDSRCWQGCVERGTSSIAGGIASWYNHSGNQSGSSSENWTQYYPKIQQNLSQAYTQKMFQLVIRTHAPLCSQQPYLQQPATGNNPDAPQQRNGYKKCGTFTQCSTTQLLKTMNL